MNISNRPKFLSIGFKTIISSALCITCIGFGGAALAQTSSSLTSVQKKLQDKFNSGSFDVNRDGKVNARDAAQLLRAISKFSVSDTIRSRYQAGEFDLDGNGVTEEKDAKYILSTAAGIDFSNM